MLLEKSPFYSVIVVLIALLPVLAMGQTNQAKKSAPMPKLWIEATTHDFGSVTAGTPLRYSFKVRNEGTADLQILSVAPSCGCTTTDFDKIIAPGAEGKITLAVEHTMGYNGETQKFATVTTTDPTQGRFRLTLHMFFKGSPQPAATVSSIPAKNLGPLVLTPSDRWSTAVVRGTTGSGIMEISNRGDKPVHITNVAAGGDNFTVKLRTVQDGKDYALSIETNPDLKAGHYTQTVRLATDNKDVAEIPIDLDVTVYPFIVAAPSAIHLSTISLESDPGKIVVPMIYLQKVRGDGLAIKSVTSDLPFLVLDWKSDIQGRRYIIHTSLDAAKVPPPGNFRGKIHIETNDQEVPSLDVSIDGSFY